MNLSWNKQNMYSEIKALRLKFNSTTDENTKCLLCKDIYAYILLLKMKDINFFKFDDIDFIKYKSIYEQNFEKEKDKLIKIIYNKYNNFSHLINHILNINIKLDNSIPNNNFIIDSNLLNYLKYFLKQFDSQLYNYFEYIYNNCYINVISKQDAFYNGHCTNMHTNKKSYIEIVAQRPYYILPTLAHEYGHAYENIIPKKDNSWIYNINIYMEVFSIFLSLAFNDFIMDTSYYNQGNYNICDLVETTFILASELKKYFINVKLEDYDNISNFIQFYDSNIALAFFEQYKINKKDAKENVNYFIHNNDIIFSDKLLKSVDIDLKRLYSGDYYKVFCEEYKRLIR